MMWQVDVPMIATIWPGSMASAAGAVTWASTLPVHTAIPAGNPVHAAASDVSAPTRSPSWAIGRATLSATNPANSGLSAARNSRDG
jgi:hypothetical protein